MTNSLVLVVVVVVVKLFMLPLQGTAALAASLDIPS